MRSKNIKKATVTIVVALAASSLLFAWSAFADAPATGTVVEGDSVPGLALGANRAEVVAAYGEPIWRQSVQEPGDQGFCGFPVSGGGQAQIRFWGADGSGPAAADDDVVTRITWTEAVSSWTTTAGINTAIAKADPDVVLVAYPDARVVTFPSGIPHSVIDYEQGIEVLWRHEIYLGKIFVSMSVFEPRAAPPLPPPVELRTYVSSIDLSFRKEKKFRKVTAFVHVRDQTHTAAEGATVFGTWIGPSGISNDAPDMAVTSGSGNAYFELTTRDRGTFTFMVQDVVLEDHRFDRDVSVTSATIKVK